MTRKKRKPASRARKSAIPASAAEPLEQIISEGDYSVILTWQAPQFFKMANFLRASKHENWGENHMFSLSTEANSLETFLDDFSARNNKTFSYLTEIVASIRGFANATHALQHLRRRIDKYDLAKDLVQPFMVELDRAIAWSSDSIGKLLTEMYKETSNQKIATPKEAVGETSFPTAYARQRLPRNVDDEDVANEAERISEVATKYLQICDVVDNLGLDQKKVATDLRHFVGKDCTEEKARQYKTSVHNLQSKYDTYIKNTAFEAGNRNLKHLRGHISVTLHLLEYVTQLVHFYERHENDIRYEPTKQRISKIINKTEVLDHAVNFGLLNAAKFLRKGRAEAMTIFPEFTKLQEQTFEVPSHVVLHLRPAALISTVAKHYGTPIQMRIGDRDWVDASSPMRVLLEIGMSPSARKVIFRGDQNILRDLKILFDCGFGEGDVDPSEKLQYLK
ncbi:MAG: HPr family phosphocarrier protein [Planctomycetes bacterium]|nr:HPr family phosphocarrier protein [Planctomycetota bacterium]